jgi:hypothetical protein
VEEGVNFPEDVLAFEMPESGTSATARNVYDNKDGALNSLMERKEYGDATDLETSSSITRITSRTEQTGDAEVILQNDAMGDVIDELFDGLDFDDTWSLEI